MPRFETVASLDPSCVSSLAEILNSISPQCPSDASFANPYLFHGFSLLDELDIYVAAGLTPREALYTATVAPAWFFELPDQNGTIAPGRRADLVLLNDNPLDGLETLRRPDAVVAGGVVLDCAALDAMAERLFEAAN
ncbi:amidohydrolase family protein [Aquicoccus sp. SU-CL01552]|uniref:amidohydrolase family protein n=1 Tax=Aquicoccus sp. SU-CL01552 TaxID=3127656 RepID=UPI0031048786